MNLQQLYIQVRTELIKQFLCDALPYSSQLIYSITIEIIARLFVLSFGNIKNSKIVYDNLHNKYSKDFLQNDEYIDCDSGIKTLRRYEKKLRQGHNANLEYYGMDNVYLIKEQNLRRKGRIYDSANLELIFSALNNSSKELLSLLIKNMLADSKKVSDKRFVDAYESYDEEYENAKKCKDKLQYIVNWVDFCRMETKCHFSLIPKIADYMSTHKNMPLKDFVNFWGTGYIEKGKPMEAYQILRYEGYINYFEQNCIEDTVPYILCERTVSSIVCNKFKETANETFKVFYEGDLDAIDKIYKFCHDTYPVIELHSSSNFYLSDGKKLNRPKIKAARKIIDYLLCPDILSAFYKKNTD